MPSSFSRFIPRLAVSASLGVVISSAALLNTASAQTVQFSKPYADATNSPSSSSEQNSTAHRGGEHFHAQGHRPPPAGYQDVPSTEFENGPDPDHEAHVKSNRDSVTGSNLGSFGSAYQDSNPIQSGQVGDATGNGWVSQRGNGF